MKTINRRKAILIDTDFYVDKEDGQLYVFGNNSGFAYSCLVDGSEGKEEIEHLRETVTRMQKEVSK